MKSLLKIASILSLLLLPTLALANGLIPVGSYVNSSTNDKGIQGIVNNFPEIMDGKTFEVKDIDSLHVSLIDLFFEGETTCSQNDPRLKFRHFSYFICLKGQQGACIDHFDQFKEDVDPCIKEN